MAFGYISYHPDPEPTLHELLVSVPSSSATEPASHCCSSELLGERIWLVCLRSGVDLFQPSLTKMRVVSQGIWCFQANPHTPSAGLWVERENNFKEECVMCEGTPKWATLIMYPDTWHSLKSLADASAHSCPCQANHTKAWCYILITISREVKWSESEVAQSCLTVCDPMDCSLPGSSVHGIFQAIVLEWIAISFSRGSSQPRDWTQVSRIVDRCFTTWAIREVKGRQTQISIQTQNAMNMK